MKYGNSLENKGKALPVATSNAEGYVFWGWKTKDNGGGDEFKVDTAVVKDIDVYALFQKADPPDGPGEEPKPKENAVKIVFDKNGGTKDADPKEWIIDKAHSFDSVFGDFPTKPERENYDFVNWNTQKNGMGKTAKLSDKPKDLLKKSDDTVLNLYAQWTVAANTDPANKVKVDFLWNDEGAHSNPYRTINLFKGDAVGRDNVPDDPERAGYSFDKWVYVDGGADFDPEAAVDKNIEVKATWKKQVSVKFYRNDDNAQPEKTLFYMKVFNTKEEFSKRSEERRVGKECRSRWSPYH